LYRGRAGGALIRRDYARFGRRSLHHVRRWQVQPDSWVQGLLEHDGSGLQFV
jgi:hypothetical protein